MDTTQWYAAALAGIIACLIVFYILRGSFNFLRTHARHYFLKHVFYADLHKYIRGSTRFDAFLILAYITGNVVCLTISLHGRTELMQRTGLVSIVNLVPLALGSHMNFVVSYCGLSFEAYSAIHRWIGRVAVFEGVVHVVLALVLRRPNLKTQIAALVAASAMIVIIITSFSSMRRHFYEIFLNLHRALAITLVTATWLHIPGDVFSIPTVYLVILCFAWASLQLLRVGQMLYRNFRNWAYSCRVAIEALPDAYQVHARISRTWKYRAGQYVYLRIPGVSYSALFQSHPYMVTWWYQYDEQQDVVVFILLKQAGFTHSLPCSSSDPPELWRAILEGPYGKEIPLDEYGTVLLFATGIGIAGQVPYMRQLLERFQSHDAKARRIALFWQVDAEEHLKWVGNWMTELLEQDSEYILDIRIFITGNYSTHGAEDGMVGRRGKHGRIVVNFGGFDIENLIQAEIGERKGRSVVSLCVNRHVGQQAREVVRLMIDKDIHLAELPFYPSV